MSWSAWTRGRDGDGDGDGEGKLKSWEGREEEEEKNLLEGGIVGSISMKEASSREVLKELGRLSKDDLMFTNHLYEKLSMDSGWEEASMAAEEEAEEGEGEGFVSLLLYGKDGIQYWSCLYLYINDRDLILDFT